MIFFILKKNKFEKREKLASIDAETKEELTISSSKLKVDQFKEPEQVASAFIGTENSIAVKPLKNRPY